MTGKSTGRLFWKFFFAFWSAQLLTSAGVGAAVWMLRGDRPAQHWQAPGMGMPAAPGWRGPAELRPGPLPPGLLAERPRPRPRPGARTWLLRPLYLTLLAGGLVSLVFAAALAWYFARPIRSLRQAFDQAANGQLGTRVGPRLAGRRDELADLGRDFDRMAGQLQQLLEGQRRLLHDVSHELRSPLARLQAATDLLAQQPERAAEFIERIERESGRMDRLVGELLTLARLDADIAPRQRERVDLAELVANVAEDAAFEGQQRGCRIVTEGDSGAVLHGDRELLHRALENVVRNALRHSPDGGTVLITSRAGSQPGWLEIRVDDEGSGVPEAELEQIFAPFVRSAGAQSQAGYGLGLAITSRVMRLHGGQASAENRAGGGLSVRLTLPAG
ncbi:HAMP domain-containing sensor histidine kinase [Malikia granosa]|uniref:histidine kinase n=1 Tax=Malikia granosa TaxID=263067 RepID=A0A2S9K7J4_9BURK|nr:ATP-binding protein [Malikia granosa]PRD66408.1 two-component sensor histidine kinase [Malikia granosa]